MCLKVTTWYPRKGPRVGQLLSRCEFVKRSSLPATWSSLKDVPCLNVNSLFVPQAFSRSVTVATTCPQSLLGPARPGTVAGTSRLPLEKVAAKILQIKDLDGTAVKILEIKDLGRTVAKILETKDLERAAAKLLEMKLSGGVGRQNPGDCVFGEVNRYNPLPDFCTRVLQILYLNDFSDCAFQNSYSPNF